MVRETISECLRNLFPGSSVSHFKPFSLFTVKLNKAAFRAAFSDLIDNALNQLGFGFFGGLRRGVGGQHGLDNAGKAKVATVLVADLASSYNNIQFRGIKSTSKVGDFGVRHDG